MAVAASFKSAFNGLAPSGGNPQRSACKSESLHNSMCKYLSRFSILPNFIELLLANAANSAGISHSICLHHAANSGRETPVRFDDCRYSTSLKNSLHCEPLTLSISSSSSSATRLSSIPKVSMSLQLSERGLRLQPK